MSNLSNSMGEGGGGGRAPGAFTDTGYGTHDGQGNVPTGAPFQKGTGYDEHGQVATSFGKWPVAYDPVTGMAVEHVTSGYNMGGADLGGGVGMEDIGGGGGLVDVSAPAQDTGAVAPPELQRAVQQFFESREQAAAGTARQSTQSAGQQGTGQGGQEPRAGENTGQGVAERLDAGAYLPDQPERTGQEAEAWRTRR